MNCLIFFSVLFCSCVCCDELRIWLDAWPCRQRFVVRIQPMFFVCIYLHLSCTINNSIDILLLAPLLGPNFFLNNLYKALAFVPIHGLWAGWQVARSSIINVGCQISCQKMMSYILVFVVSDIAYVSAIYGSCVPRVEASNLASPRGSKGLLLHLRYF